jgi:hypothetical protein
MPPASLTRMLVSAHLMKGPGPPGAGPSVRSVRGGEQVGEAEDRSGRFAPCAMHSGRSYDEVR